MWNCFTSRKEEVKGKVSGEYTHKGFPGKDIRVLPRGKENWEGPDLFIFQKCHF